MRRMPSPNWTLTVDFLYPCLQGAAARPCFAILSLTGTSLSRVSHVSACKAFQGPGNTFHCSSHDDSCVGMSHAAATSFLFDSPLVRDHQPNMRQKYVDHVLCCLDHLDQLFALSLFFPGNLTRVSSFLFPSVELVDEWRAAVDRLAWFSLWSRDAV